MELQSSLGNEKTRRYTPTMNSRIIQNKLDSSRHLIRGRIREVKSFTVMGDGLTSSTSGTSVRKDKGYGYNSISVSGQ